jgi:hypothetical protein
MRFRCEKLYADLVTPDGTVCVAYLAWLDAWGLRRTFAGLELYWPDGRREIAHARPQSGPTGSPPRDLDLSFDVPGGPFVLTYRTAHGPWRPAGGPPREGLRWEVKAARAEAVGRWTNDPRRPELRGIGYVDSVEMDRPVRHLDLGALRWGRVHLPDATFVFNAVDFRSGASWHRAARWSEGVMVEWDAFRLDDSMARTIVQLPDRRGHLSIAPDRALHVGDAIDHVRFPGAVARMVSRAVTGPAAERRSLGRARWTTDGPQSSWALHETVRFDGSSP